MEDGKIKTEEERMQEIEAVEANVKCMKDFTSPEQLYEELIRSIRKYHPSTVAADQNCTGQLSGLFRVLHAAA